MARSGTRTLNTVRAARPRCPRTPAALTVVFAIMAMALAACSQSLGIDLNEGTSAPPGAADNPIDGTWTGTMTWTDFAPPAAPAANGVACRSAAGLPITVPLTLTFTTLPDGTGAVAGTLGGGTCRIFETGSDTTSSVWEVASQFSTKEGGPMTWKAGTVAFTLPGGQTFRGGLQPGAGAMDGTVTGSLSYGELSGAWQVTGPTGQVVDP